LKDAETPYRLAQDLVTGWIIDAGDPLDSRRNQYLLRERIRELLIRISVGEVGILDDIP